MTPTELELRQQFDEALARVEAAERAMSQSQARLDHALRKAHDTALARRLRKETHSLMLNAKQQVDQARSALDAYLLELDRGAAERMMRATHESIEALLARFDTSKWENNQHAN